MELTLLDRTRHVDDAGYLCGEREGCMKGTRRDVLVQLEQWLRDEQAKRVFWLNGLAGTGKSTIAKTFAEMCFAAGGLGASFFCSRDTEEKSNLHSIFPTLSFQLAHRFAQFRQELLPALRENPDVRKESLVSQMEKLIVGPFQATQIRTLIIIDALDECRDEASTSALLSVLSRYVDKIPNVKFFITGRPDPGIRFAFRSKSLQPHTHELQLHHVDRSSVDSDIKLYLKIKLIELADNRPDCSFPMDWPAPHYVDFFCRKAAGLFIYAATVVKFASSRYHLPNDRLYLLFSHRQDTSHEEGSGIDHLYTNVLEQAFRDASSHDDKLYSNFKSVVGAVVLIFHPLSISTLSDLLRDCGDASSISSSLQPLHSVFLVPNPDTPAAPVQIFHKSFPDFLTDKKRCTDDRFFIDPSIHHKKILVLCLNLMKRRLRRNICNLDSHISLGDIKDLPTLKNTCIGNTLQYACCFWTNHLINMSDISGDIKELHTAIDDFFTTGFLFWIEVLILTGNLDIGIHGLNNIEQWYTSVSHLQIS